MSVWSSTIKAGFLEAWRVFGCEFVVGSGTTRYRGIQRDTTEMMPLMVGGFPDDFSGGMEYLIDDVTLTQGDKITIYAKNLSTGGVTYRIPQFASASDDPVRVAYLQGVNK